MRFLNLWRTVNNAAGFLLGGGSSRTVTLTCEDERFVLPVTPWKYQVSMGQLNKIVDILDFGEAQLFGNPKLAKLSFSCFFPSLTHEYPFVVGDAREPSDCVALMQKWKEGKKPVRVIITDSPFNLAMAIESFEWQEQDTSRDIYYKLEFTEWKELNVPQANNEKQTDEQTGLKERQGNPKLTKTQKSIQQAKDVLEASKRAYGKVQKWRGLLQNAKNGGLVGPVLHEARAAIRRGMRGGNT